LQLAEALDQVVRDALPHILCSYLYEFASLFMSFYETWPILKDGVPEETRRGCLLLCRSTANVLATGMALLGIEVMEKCEWIFVWHSNRAVCQMAIGIIKKR
jgi:arginyl-tRNA synthetase